MEFIKKNLAECIISFAFIIFFLIGIISVFMMWNQGSGSVYGNRLEGIKEVKIEDKKLTEISSSIKENTIIASASSKIEGKIINYYLEVNTGTKKEDAKKASEIILEKFSKKELEFYDVQVFITEKDKPEGSTYPIIGYKSKTTEKFVWTNNK